MLSNHSIDQVLIFNNLTEKKIQNAQLYFQAYPAANKYSKKRIKLGCSFIKTNNGLFAISNHVIGSGMQGRVKIAKNITTNQLVAVKIKLHHIFGREDYEDAINESYILNELGRLYAAALRWSDNSIEAEANRFEFPDTSQFWVNKYCTDKKYRFIKYNLKFYIFTVLFNGITLSKYIENIKVNNQTLLTEKKLEIILKVLEKIEILHKKNIVHGDLNLHNILISDSIDEEMEIQLIDFGFAAILKHGIARYRLFDFSYSNSSYVPPECDRKIVQKQIIPELKNVVGQQITRLQFQMIFDWSKHGYGFIHAASDLYSFCWNIYHFININKDPTLNENFVYYDLEIPFFRGSLKFLMNTYQEKFNQLMERKIVRKLINVVLGNQDKEVQEEQIEEITKKNDVKLLTENRDFNQTLIYSFSDNNSFDKSILNNMVDDIAVSTHSDQLVISTTEKLKLLTI